MLGLYCIGLFISLSKASFVLLIFAAMYGMRRQLRAIHTARLAARLLRGDNGDRGVNGPALISSASETFAHRFAGYPFLLDAQFADLVRGVTARQLNDEYGYLPYVGPINRQLYFISTT